MRTRTGTLTFFRADQSGAWWPKYGSSTSSSSLAVCKASWIAARAIAGSARIRRSRPSVSKRVNSDSAQSREASRVTGVEASGRVPTSIRRVLVSSPRVLVILIWICDKNAVMSQ